MRGKEASSFADNCGRGWRVVLVETTLEDLRRGGMQSEWRRLRLEFIPNTAKADTTLMKLLS